MENKNNFERKPSLIRCPLCRGRMENLWQTKTPSGSPRRIALLVSTECGCGHSEKAYNTQLGMRDLSAAGNTAKRQSDYYLKPNLNPMGNPKCVRHGEIAFERVDSIPKGLKLSNTNIIVTGSHGHGHTFDNGKLYLLAKEGPNFVFGYLKANGTTLFHAEHGKNGKAKLPDGMYRLHKQHEHTPAGLVPVID